MTEPPDQPAKHGRSLVGFYIGLGVVAALVGLGVWLSTPVRILYWEREVREPTIRNESERALASWKRVEATEKLVAIGPRASPALVRLLTNNNPITVADVTLALNRQRPSWAVSVLVEACRNPETCGTVLGTAEKITGRSFTDAAMFLDWWEREGKAKYGGGEK